MRPVVESSARRELRNLARRLGYQDDLLVYDFPVLHSSGIARPSLVGFAATPKDMTTATFVADALPGGDIAKSAAFRAAEALAAPTLVTSNNSEIEVWWLGEGKDAPARIASFNSGDRGATDFAETSVGRSLSPEALLRAKRGSTQPSLFPISVSWIQQSRGSTEDRLEDLVGNSLASARVQFERYRKAVSDRELTRLVLSAFTLSFIRDRFGLIEESPSWTSHLRETHPHLNSWRNGLDKVDRLVLQTLMGELQFSVNLSALDPALMSNVYERTLVTDEERGALGVVYTPSELARQLLNRMPIEEIAPEERRVLDPTCGSGTLLLAAHDRLRDLVSQKVASRERHNWITGHLAGWDKDPFAVEVARLCLTLNALPEGNGWRIEERDALGATELDKEGIAKPTIIVGNPPWKSHRSDGGSRGDSASIFFERSLQLLAPEGVLGMVMPAGWLSARYSSSARRHLRELCEVLEIWRLPERTFRNAEAAPTVIIAKKTARVRRIFHVERRVINRKNLDRFYYQGVADSTTLTQTTAPPAERPEKEGAFMARPLTGRVSNALWQTYLSDIARLRSGPPRHAGASSGTGKFLRADRLSLTPYFSEVVRDACSPVRWPEDFDAKSASNPDDFSADKLLLAGKIRPDSPWSSRVRLDKLGVVPTDAYIMVIPKADSLPSGFDTDSALYSLMAILGSTFASAWIDERRTTRNIPPELFRNLPMPPGWHKLADVGRELARFYAVPNELRRVLQTVDARVFDLYGLSSIEVDAFRSKYADVRSPEGVSRFDAPAVLPPVAPSDEALCTYGAVLDLTQRDLTLWAPGITPDEGVTVPLPPRFPGALLYRGADFAVRADVGDIFSGEFNLHASAWKSPLLSASAPGDAGTEGDDELGLGFDDGEYLDGPHD